MAKRRNRSRNLAKSNLPVPVSPAALGQLAPQQAPQEIADALRAQGMNTSALLGPGVPLNPAVGYSLDPRSFDYPTGVNITTTSRSRASWGRTSFDTLKAIIDAYDVARMCINHKIDELRSMEPLFTPIQGFHGDAREAVAAARKALEFPDRQHPYDAWLSMWLEGCLRYDAGTLYKRRDLEGNVIGLEVVDGTTVFPYIDAHGRVPEPPAPAFFQAIKGLPWVWLTTDDIVRTTYRPQDGDPYGLAPIESILLTANTDLRFQWHFLQMFTEGSIPAGFMELPPDISSPDQVREWQAYWDVMVLGDQAKLHQLIAVPGGSKFTETRPKAFDKTFPEYLMKRTAAAYGVVPQDLGLVDDVNRANGETQTDMQFRVHVLPWVRFVEGTLSRYLVYDLGLPVKVNLATGREKEDRVQEAQAWKLYIETGMASPDEGRAEVLGLPVDNERPTPRFVLDPRTGPVPLRSIMAIAGPIDPETAAPADEQPLDTTPFEGAGGVLPDKAPGGTQFKRAPIDPDDPTHPELEQAVPGSELVGVAPATKPTIESPVEGTQVSTLEAATSVVDEAAKRAQSLPVAKLPATPVAKGADPVGDHNDMVAELSAFRRFVKARKAQGKWRDFRFEVIDEANAALLNRGGRAEIDAARDARPKASSWY